MERWTLTVPAGSATFCRPDIVDGPHTAPRMRCWRIVLAGTIGSKRLNARETAETARKTPIVIVLSNREIAIAHMKDVNHMTEEIERLNREIAALLALHGDGVNSASRVINPLLSIWSIAAEIDPSIALPVQNLLSVLPHRALISADELNGVFAQMRVAIDALATAVPA